MTFIAVLWLLFVYIRIARSLAIIFVDCFWSKTKSINFQCVFADLFLLLLLYFAVALVVVIIVSLPLFVMLP